MTKPTSENPRLDDASCGVTFTIKFKSHQPLVEESDDADDTVQDIKQALKTTGKVKKVFGCVIL